MCAILGFLDKTGRRDAPIGRILLRMLLAVGCRGPDSTGVAVFGPDSGGLVLQVKLGESGDFPTLAQELTQRIATVAPVREHAVTGPYLRVVVDGNADPKRLIKTVEQGAADAVEVVSMGHRLEILKQVGSPQELEDTYGISRLVGTHGIGHTRLSTESRVDLSHSQPFWAHGLPDVATAHNGHITNYHKLRRIYEQRGIHFYTENDSEIIATYLRERMAQGDSLEEALRASLTDFDGSFCYLAATEDALAFVKDPFGLKPLVVAETADWVAIATEEIALRQALGEDFTTREPGTRTLRIWHLAEAVAVAA
jgi:glutamate synthase domain-containing protein 1